MYEQKVGPIFIQVNFYTIFIQVSFLFLSLGYTFSDNKKIAYYI